MLRVEFRDAPNRVIMRMEGRFVGEYAEETKNLVNRNLPARIVVDLSEVTFVDGVGEQVLSWLSQIGAKFLADSSYARDICERLRLPKARKRITSPRQATAFAD